MPLVQRLIPRADVTPDMKYTGESGPFAPMTGTPYAMERATFMSPLGIPCMQPPWGTVSAVDLASGKQIWQQPAGTAKDIAFGTFQPGLAFYVGLPPLGGPLVTKGGIAWYGGTQDYYLRAFDVVSGKLLWKGRLPVGSQATPISYVGKDGRQYVVINASGARYNKVLAQFRRRPEPPGHVLEWVCHGDLSYLDLTKDRMELTPTPMPKSSDGAALNSLQ